MSEETAEYWKERWEAVLQMAMEDRAEMQDRIEELERTVARHVEMHVRMAERLCIRQDADGSITDEIDRLGFQISELQRNQKLSDERRIHA
jgi:hypothetical protein